ncbi:MAG: inorganic phosphate transporter [Clostridia bacterium]|nr:inorganic phosphate transporter [Clostridia bacterium]
MTTFLVVTVIILAVSFDFINGFHDTANSIATTVSTRVLSPKMALLLAACLNFIGALLNQKVAGTVAKDIVDKTMVKGNSGLIIVIGALVGAIIWNLITWYFGIPSSSSHALFGGMIGSSIAFTQTFSVVKWWGVMQKVIIPLFTSPIIGLFLGFLFMKLLYKILRPFTQQSVNKWFSKLQILSAGFMAYSHGNNDAQKSMGIITLALVTANMNNGQEHVQPWVVLLCAIAMALGTSVGGWKIIKTMGVNMIRLQPIQGFAAETCAATVIETMTHFGAPVSTTHIISTAIMGVGAAKRVSAVRWSIAKNILWAWFITIPFTAVLGGLVAALLKLL